MRRGERRVKRRWEAKGKNGDEKTIREKRRVMKKKGGRVESVDEE
jgi:hypothetical protein